MKTMEPGPNAIAGRFLLFLSFFLILAGPSTFYGFESNDSVSLKFNVTVMRYG